MRGPGRASSARSCLRRAKSGGAASRQRSKACGHRGAKEQPGGSAARSGGWPSIAVSRWRVVAHPRDRVEQRLGVGMVRRVEDLRHRSRLDDPSGIHHRELVAHLGDDAEIVGDEDQREAVLALQVAQQVEVLRLDRQVEAGGRLVGDQQARLAGYADGADDALAHAARHLVRVLRHPRLRRRDAHGLQQAPSPGSRRLRASALMHPDRLGDLVADREQRVQRGHRVLQDHRDALAADVRASPRRIFAGDPRPRTASGR